VIESTIAFLVSKDLTPHRMVLAPEGIIKGLVAGNMTNAGLIPNWTLLKLALPDRRDTEPEIRYGGEERDVRGRRQGDDPRKSKSAQSAPR
jgi:hypothetical protein